MRTEDLIDALATDAPAEPADFLSRRVALAVGAGALVAFAILMAWWGLRHDLAQAARSAFFWIKLGYGAAFAAAGAALVDRYGRPGGAAGSRWMLVAAPVVVLAAIALAVSVGVAPDQLRRNWLGHSWSVCAFHILALAAPVFVAALWAFRRLAPTRLRLAGFAAGLMAGGAGAAVYGLACTENTALFVLSWYTLGIAACAAVGALLGPRLLRW